MTLQETADGLILELLKSYSRGPNLGIVSMSVDLRAAFYEFG